MSVVLDASALLAYLQREAGADIVKAALGEAVISTVNWAGVVQKGLGLLARGPITVGNAIAEVPGGGLFGWP